MHVNLFQVMSKVVLDKHILITYSKSRRRNTRICLLRDFNLLPALSEIAKNIVYNLDSLEPLTADQQRVISRSKKLLVRLSHLSKLKLLKEAIFRHLPLVSVLIEIGLSNCPAK